MKRLAILNNRLEVTEDPAASEPDWTAYAPLRGVSMSPDALAEVLRLHLERWRAGRPADLTGANLSSAYLSGADLRYATLSDADLRRADLTGADLTDADLRRAYLSGADLTGAYLSGAYLSGADLTGAMMPDGRPFAAYRADPLAGICDEPEVRARAEAAMRADGHTWQNCPMHAAFGIESIDQAPEDKRAAVAAFVALYDARLLEGAK